MTAALYLGNILIGGGSSGGDDWHVSLAGQITLDDLGLIIARTSTSSVTVKAVEGTVTGVDVGVLSLKTRGQYPTWSGTAGQIDQGTITTTGTAISLNEQSGTAYGAEALLAVKVGDVAYLVMLAISSATKGIWAWRKLG